MVHERLSIVDLEKGFQPLQSLCDPKIMCVANGEIYNHQSLRSQLGHHKFKTDSDCEVILHLVKRIS